LPLLIRDNIRNAILFKLHYVTTVKAHRFVVQILRGLQFSVPLCPPLCAELLVKLCPASLDGPVDAGTGSENPGREGIKTRQGH